MTPQELLEYLEKHGCQLEAKLFIRAPRGVATPEISKLIEEHRWPLLRLFCEPMDGSELAQVAADWVAKSGSPEVKVG